MIGKAKEGEGNIFIAKSSFSFHSSLAESNTALSFTALTSWKKVALCTLFPSIRPINTENEVFLSLTDRYYLSSIYFPTCVQISLWILNGDMNYKEKKRKNVWSSKNSPHLSPLKYQSFLAYCATFLTSTSFFPTPPSHFLKLLPWHKAATSPTSKAAVRKGGKVGSYEDRISKTCICLTSLRHFWSSALSLTPLAGEKKYL